MHINNINNYSIKYKYNNFKKLNNIKTINFTSNNENQTEKKIIKAPGHLIAGMLMGIFIGGTSATMGHKANISEQNTAVNQTKAIENNYNEIDNSIKNNQLSNTNSSYVYYLSEIKEITNSAEEIKNQIENAQYEPYQKSFYSNGKLKTCSDKIQDKIYRYEFDEEGTLKHYEINDIFGTKSNIYNNHHTVKTYEIPDLKGIFTYEDTYTTYDTNDDGKLDYEYNDSSSKYFENGNFKFKNELTAFDDMVYLYTYENNDKNKITVNTYTYDNSTGNEIKHNEYLYQYVAGEIIPIE